MSFEKYYINRIIQYIAFWGYLLILGIIAWRCIQIVVCINSSLLFVPEQCFTTWMYIVLSHSPTEGYLCFQFRLEAAMNAHIQVFV